LGAQNDVDAHLNKFKAKFDGATSEFTSSAAAAAAKTD
jgi:hypothetical protein